MQQEASKQYRSITLPSGKVIIFDRSITGWIAAQVGYPNRYGVPRRPKLRLRGLLVGGAS